MLLSLSHELIEQIVRLSTPDKMTKEIYRQRQRTLRAVCLVHSLLRQIALPVLEEAYHHGDDAGSLFTEDVKRIAPRLRFVWIGEWSGVIWRDVADFLHSLVKIEELWLNGLAEVELDVLSTL